MMKGYIYSTVQEQSVRRSLSLTSDTILLYIAGKFSEELNSAVCAYNHHISLLYACAYMYDDTAPSRQIYKSTNILVTLDLGNLANLNPTKFSSYMIY